MSKHGKYEIETSQFYCLQVNKTETEIYKQVTITPTIPHKYERPQKDKKL